MAQLLRENLFIIWFIYGLIFFALGQAIVMQPRRNSVYYLATALSWMAAFAFVHAAADWLLMFIPAHQEAGHAGVVKVMYLFRGIGIAVSFGLLMQFGLSLLLEKQQHLWWLKLLPGLLTMAFVFMLLIEYGPNSITGSFLFARITMRYVLGFPAAVLSGLGLLTQVGVLKQDRLGRHARYLYGAAACLFLYAIVGGLIVPEGPFFPANVINEGTFFRVAHMPVEVIRGLTVAGLTYFIVRLVDIFHVETLRRLHEAENDRSLLWERERIARELHDGIMQTLYGTGLGLKQMLSLTGGQGPQAAILTELNREIGRAIVQMRRFVLDLKEQSVTCADLSEAIRAQAREIEQFAGIRVTVETEFPPTLETRVPAGMKEEMLALLREGLSNVVRHSQATEARVLFCLEDDTALLRISDEGVGFEPANVASGRGLEAARERVEALGGFLQVLSAPGDGAQVIAHLPVSGSRRSKRKELSA